jgi:hypothetical protein
MSPYMLVIVRNGSELRRGLPPFRLKKRDPPTLLSEALFSKKINNKFLKRAKNAKNAKSREKSQK